MIKTSSLTLLFNNSENLSTLAYLKSPDYDNLNLTSKSQKNFTFNCNSKTITAVTLWKWLPKNLKIAGMGLQLTFLMSNH